MKSWSQNPTEKPYSLSEITERFGDMKPNEKNIFIFEFCYLE